MLFICCGVLCCAMLRCDAKNTRWYMEGCETCQRDTYLICRCIIMVKNDGAPVPLASLLQLATFLFCSCICLKTIQQAFEITMVVYSCKHLSPDLQRFSSSSDIGITTFALNNNVVDLCRSDNLQTRLCAGQEHAFCVWQCC